ncbi:MAG TPA: response regulator [Thermoanaerobaculia bacterium]|nr:response regulator [Thermoanaerobaculia bacterium]
MAPSNERPDARILIVDDQPANVRLLEHTLRRAGYLAVTATTDPRDVAALQSQHRYDLIVLDLQMPNLNGFEVMEQLRRISEEERPVILVMSADSAQKAAALEAGATSFLGKPFKLPDVVAHIQSMLVP